MKERKNQIVIALDNEINDGISLLEKINEDKELKKRIYGIKIGSLWILENGIEIVKKVHNIIWDQCAIILDMQKWPTDTNHIVKRQVEKVAEAEVVDEIIACPMGSGRKSLETFVVTCKDSGIRPLCVLEMTHPESETYLKPGYYKDILYDSASLGVDGFIIPATKEPKVEIKWHLETAFPKLLADFYTIGYKVQGGNAWPMIKFGVNKFIVGRGIYDANDPVEAIYNTYNEINGFG